MLGDLNDPVLSENLPGYTIERSKRRFGLSIRICQKVEHNVADIFKN